MHSGQGLWTLPGSADVDFVDLSCILEGRYQEEDTWVQIWHKADGTYYVWAHEEFVLTASLVVCMHNVFSFDLMLCSIQVADRLIDEGYDTPAWTEYVPTFVAQAGSDGDDMPPIPNRLFRLPMLGIPGERANSVNSSMNGLGPFGNSPRDPWYQPHSEPDLAPREESDQPEWEPEGYIPQ